MTITSDIDLYMSMLEEEKQARAAKRERDAEMKVKPVRVRRNRLKPYSRNRRHLVNQYLDELADHYEDALIEELIEDIPTIE